MKKGMWIVAMMAMLGVGVCYADGPARVPAYRGIIERVQPNGDTLRTYLRGDEHMHWMMTEDGWQIKESKRGWLKYARLNRKGQVVISCRKARNADKRSKCETKWLEKHGVKKN
jgi:hypothetical protein